MAGESGELWRNRLIIRMVALRYLSSRAVVRFPWLGIEMLFSGKKKAYCSTLELVIDIAMSSYERPLSAWFVKALATNLGRHMHVASY